MRCLPLLLVLLGGCSSRVDDLMEERAIMERSGDTETALCRQDRKIQEAYLQSGDEDDYRQKKASTDIECRLGEMDNSK